VDLSDLPPHEERGLVALMSYWVECWNGDCGGRFGIDQAQLQGVLAAWPQATWEQERVAALAIGSTLRESLYGADARERDHILQRAGLSLAQACALLDDLTPRIQHALRS